LNYPKSVLLATVFTPLFFGCGDSERPLLGYGSRGVPIEPDAGAGGAPLISNIDASGSNNVGCAHLDVLFSVDSSGSMTEERVALRDEVFPAFAQELLSLASIEDFRASVLDACPTPANYHTRGIPGDCSFESGQVWMDSTSSDIGGEFACVADLWTDDVQCSGDDDDEQPAVAAVTSLEQPWSNGPNTGFLRDDALLVVVAITDEDETPEPHQSPQQIYQRLVEAKGNAEHVVFLGIGGLKDCEGAYGQAEEASILKQLTELFAANGRGYFWDICDGNLADGLAKALGPIEDACDKFESPK